MPSIRSTRYKDKFQALREKYDRVNTAHSQYERDLMNAEGRLKGLQDEIDLLLEAITEANIQQNIRLPEAPSLPPIILHHELQRQDSNDRQSLPLLAPESDRSGFSTPVFHVNGNGSSKGMHIKTESANGSPATNGSRRAHHTRQASRDEAARAAREESHQDHDKQPLSLQFIQYDQGPARGS
ncbi:hypothetical protein C8J56DRAFT_327404 [Mycena floridula]|nr:hypothetical protein C8J56DRAFT_327404 [Mycena floridula]